MISGRAEFFFCPAAADSVSTYIPNILGISKNAYQKKIKYQKNFK